jgi:hypothetical protein
MFNEDGVLTLGSCVNFFLFLGKRFVPRYRFLENLLSCAGQYLVPIERAVALLHLILSGEDFR